MIGRMLSAGLDTNPIIVDYSYDMPKYLKEQYLGMFVKYTGNNTDEYKNGYTYQVSQKQSGTDTVYFFAPYFYLESLASSADTSKIIDGYQAYNDNGKKIVGRYKTSEKVITENGTFYPADDSINAYSKVTVNVAGPDPGAGSDDFWVKVIDYDGTVLLEKRGNNGDSFELPSAPSHEGLVFQEWSASCPITDGKVIIDNNNIMVAAVYTTSSGQNEFDITLTKVTGLSVTLNMDGTKDWGDGTSDTNTTHTYTAYGDYTIKCNGTTMTTSSNSGLFGQTSTINYYCTEARFATVTSIGDYALRICHSLTSVVIPNGVTSINNGAFYSCYSLTSVVIPNSVTSIGSKSFNGCVSLTSIIIPGSVTSVGDYAFNGCSSLTSIIIPGSVTSVGNNAFNGCNSLTSIIIHGSVTSIGDFAFNGCGSLTSVVLPDGVTSIGRSAFYNCYSLKSVIIPIGVTSIGIDTFHNCFSLTSVILPDGVTSIGDYAFYGCGALKSAILPNGIKRIANSAFQSCYSLTSVIIPDGVTSIDGSAFYDCGSLTSVIIPNGVTNIGSSAFYGCNSLTSIIIPDSVTSIFKYAFYNCGSLTSIIIPDSVTSIGNSVFYGCFSLTKYDFSQCTAVPTLSNKNAFSGINKIAKIIVPDSLYDEWIAATNWSTYADYIYKASEVTV